MNSINITIVLNDETKNYNFTTLYSAIVNKNENSKYNIYILNNSKYNIEKEIQLMQKNKSNVNIKEIKTNDKYPLLKLKKYLPKNINKIIFLNYNTIVLKDLSELFNLSIMNKTIAGILDYNVSILKNERDFDYQSNKYINTSVLLIDLEKFKDISDETEYYFKEQTIINKNIFDSFLLNYRYGLINDKDLNLNLELSNKKHILENVLDGINNTNIIIFKKYPWENLYVIYGDLWIKYYTQFIYLLNN